MTEGTVVWPRGIPAVGQTASQARTVTVRDIERFTEMTGDRNPLHYDEAMAKKTRMGGIVVQNAVLSGGSVAGGLLFLAALIPLSVVLLREG